MNACVYVYVCGIYIYIYMSVCAFVCVYMHVFCMLSCVCVCVCVRAHPCVVYLCAYMHMCSCVCEFQTQDFLPFKSAMSNTKKRVNIFFSLESYVHLIHANIQHTQRNPCNTKWLQILKLLLNTEICHELGIQR